MNLHVVIIRGPLGVGKTTVAKQLAEKLGGQYFSIDTALDMSGNARSEGDYVPDDFVRAQEYILPQIQRAMREGYSIVLDGNFYFKEQIQHLKEHIKKTLLIFTLQASVEECIARDRIRTHSFGEKSARAIYALVTKLDVGTPIDTEKINPNDVVSEILQRISRTDTK